MKQIIIISLTVLAISACTPMAEQVMPPLQYKEPVNVHVAKNAYLNWEVGKQYSSTMPTFISPSAGLLGAAIATAVDTEERERNPGRYTFTYGKAQQAVFMTSLRQVLEENGVFKKVELTTELPALTAKDVLVSINFKRTRVADTYENFKIILDVELNIKAKGKPEFSRTYFVESDPGGAFSAKGFKEQQTDVSLQLLRKVIAGIKTWQEQ